MAYESAFKKRTDTAVQTTTTGGGIKLKNIEDFLHNVRATDADRTAFVTDWLMDNYEINVNEKPAFFSELFRIHNHDNLPLHLGAAYLETMLGSAWVELIKNESGQWRLSVAQNQDMSDREILDFSTDIHEDSGELLYLKTLLAAPAFPRQTQSTGKYSSLDMSQNPAGIMEESNELEPINPAAIPAFLFTGQVMSIPVNQW